MPPAPGPITSSPLEPSSIGWSSASPFVAPDVAPDVGESID